MKHYLDRLEQTCKSHWTEDALCDYKGDKFTYCDFATQIEKFHLFFEKVGLKKGDKVAVCAKNTARWGVSFFSINTYEAVAVPILVDFHPDSINSLVDHSESKILFTDSDIWPKLKKEEMPQIKVVISSTDFSLLYSDNDKITEAYNSIDSMLSAKYPKGYKKEDVNFPKNNDKDLAIINYTSGTTSAPKGVMIRFECVTANVDFAAIHLPAKKGDTIVSMLPMAHMYGMMFELIFPICCGATVYYLGKTPTPAVLLGAMSAIKPYLLITVPLVMEKVFKSKVKPVLDKPVIKVLSHIPGLNQIIFKKVRETLLSAFGGNIQSIIMGGAALNPDVEKWFKKFKLPYTVGYGMTEAAPLMAYSSWQTFAPHSCGRAIDTITVRIDSEDPQNVVGQIQAKGMNIMSGYYKNEEATAAAFTEDGWMNTGDLGVVDAQGNIFIRGRSKNMILTSNGQNIYPEEVEAACNNQPYVIESVVVNRNDHLVALVYLDEAQLKADGISGAMLDQKLTEIQTSVNKGMPVYSKITKVEVVDSPFEKTPKMSIKRFLYK